MRRAIGVALALLAGPALAQTDDRISNDALTLLAADTVIAEIGRLCVADSGDDAAVVAAFEGWRERNHGWRIVGVSTLGSRGVAYSPDALAVAQDKVRGSFMPLYEAAEQKPDWCRRMADDIATGQLDAGLVFPEAATRVEEAQSGKWPVLDVENSYAVYNATEVLDWFDHTEQFLARCGAAFGDPGRRYADAYPYWRSRNIEAWSAADRIMTNWGALDPKRLVALRDGNAREIEAQFAIETIARSACEDFVGTVEDGMHDIATIDPFLAEFVAGEADTVP